MTIPNKKVDEALRKCEKILDQFEEPYVIFFFEEQGCSVSNHFCCDRHMAINVFNVTTDILNKKGPSH